MTFADVWAVVPIKPFARAKFRLAAALAPAQRNHLARLMAEDVLDHLTACRHFLCGVMVVTSDPSAAALALRYGAEVLREPTAAGINPAVALAAARLKDNAMIVVPADLPQISADTIGKIARLLTPQRAVAMVPAIDGGTNILALRPAGIIPPSFGPNSFERHRKAACNTGVFPSVLADRELAHDIDHPDDLAAFASLQTATRTHAFLASAGLASPVTATHRPARAPIASPAP